MMANFFSSRPPGLMRKLTRRETHRRKIGKRVLAIIEKWMALGFEGKELCPRTYQAPGKHVLH